MKYEVENEVFIVKKFSFLAAGLLMSFILGGCGNSKQEDTAALEQQVADLKQQIADMQQNSSGTNATSTEGNTISENNEADMATAEDNRSEQAADSGDTANSQSGSYTIEDLTARAEDFMQRASDIVASKDTPEMEQFFTLKKELSQLERDLDVHEDELEDQYRSGALSRDAYREQERTLEALDDRLDETEDRLELKFGIID